MRKNLSILSLPQLATFGAVCLLSAPAFGQKTEGPPAGALVPSAPATAPKEEPGPAPVRTPDRVELKDGTVFEGVVMRYEEGKFVVIQMPDGRDLIFTAALIKKVTTGVQQSAPPAGVLSGEATEGTEQAPGSVKVETTTTVNTAAGTFTHEVKMAGEVERTLLDVKAATARREIIGADGSHTTMALDGKAGKASYEHERDCEDPNSDLCKEKMAVELSGKGLEASYHKTTVTRVKDPPKKYTMGTISAGAMFFFGDISGGGATANLGVRGGFGGKLPGPEGGMWNGLGYDLGTGLSAFSVAGTTSGMLQLGLGAGWNGYKFGKMDEATLKQGGFGWLLGARFMVTVPFQGADPSPTFGPQITVSIPKYNAGTAKMSDFHITGMILPVGNITFGMIQAGFGFGG